MKTLQLAILLSPLIISLVFGVYKPQSTSTGVKKRSSASRRDDRLRQLETQTKRLARQLMLQQLYIDEKSRSEGDSGIKQVRLKKGGTKPYYVTSFSDESIASIHDHSDHFNTVGMGELFAVLNGVEFRTRHNDYKLSKPSTTSKDFHAVEEITYPEVPPEVTSQSTLDLQMYEMRQWFKAWQEENTSVRDYRPYFQPLLCYLEGAWVTDSAAVEEPFDSDRHYLDADTWLDLQEKIRFMSYTGEKDGKENLAFLPTTIINVTDDGEVIFGQWVYRILCHPIKENKLRLSHLKPVDNLHNRLTRRESYNDYIASRGARFKVNPHDSEHRFKWDLIDELMGQVPGLDNYKANITSMTFRMREEMSVITDKRLNTGFYHRWYKLSEKDAMGQMNVPHGFADNNMWVAETTQTKVAPISCHRCFSVVNSTGTSITKRLSYAIPLEVIWLTPLHRWNPYGIQHKGRTYSSWGKTVHADKRNGGVTHDTAFNGTNARYYYNIPVEFFENVQETVDIADTTISGNVGVLDAEGNLRNVTSAGVHIILPEMLGLGRVRIRYPIMPIYYEGSPIMKELEALRDLVLDMNGYKKYFQANPPFVVGNGEGFIPDEPQKRIHSILTTSFSYPEPVGLHRHEIRLTRKQNLDLRTRGITLNFITSWANGHDHAVTIDFDEETKRYLIIKCDGRPVCTHGHAPALDREKL